MKVGEEPMELLRDGRVILTGTEHECIGYLHRMHGYSASHALRYEGYFMRPWIWESFRDESEAKP